MTGYDATTPTLTRSFRSGPLIAEEANWWLSLADAPIRLTAARISPPRPADHRGTAQFIAITVGDGCVNSTALSPLRW